MLVGVGGSGKQSLARLAAHISGYDVFQIAVSSTYGVADFKEALLSLYTKVNRVMCGSKAMPPYACSCACGVATSLSVCDDSCQITWLHHTVVCIAPL
jgi:hypothetical protein